MYRWLDCSIFNQFSRQLCLVRYWICDLLKLGQQRLLDVPAKILAPGGPGAVSEETVLAMVQGAVSNSEASISVAVSGVAGPAGGSAAKPVGTVWIAWQVGAVADAACFHFDGDREAVRLATVEAALAGLIQRITEQN